MQGPGELRLVDVLPFPPVAPLAREMRSVVRRRAMTDTLTDREVYGLLTEDERDGWDDTDKRFPLLRTLATERKARREAEASLEEMRQAWLHEVRMGHPGYDGTAVLKADLDAERALADRLAEALGALLSETRPPGGTSVDPNAEEVRGVFRGARVRFAEHAARRRG